MRLVIPCECDGDCDHHPWTYSQTGWGCSSGSWDEQACPRNATGEDRLCDSCRLAD